MDSSALRRCSSVINFVLWMLGLVIVLVACQPSMPTIVQSFTQLNHSYNPESKKWKETLSVWAQVQNKDGWTDIQKIIIRHPKTEVWWKLDKSNWAFRQQGEAIWLGTNFLKTVDDSPLPKGTWSITVVTKAGQTSETEFTLAAPIGVEKKQEYDIPIFHSHPPFRLDHFPLPYLVWIYDSQGNFISSLQQNEHTIVSPLLTSPEKGPQQVRWLVFYAKNSLGEGV